MAGDFKSNEELKQFFIDMAPLYSNKARQQGINVQAFDTMSLTYEATNKGFAKSMRELNYTPDLHKIKCPTLVFAGEDDWICPPEFAQKIAEEIPKAQLRIFTNSNHSVGIDVHDEYIQTLRNFILS